MGWLRLTWICRPAVMIVGRWTKAGIIPCVELPGKREDTISMREIEECRIVLFLRKYRSNPRALIAKNLLARVANIGMEGERGCLFGLA